MNKSLSNVTKEMDVLMNNNPQLEMKKLDSIDSVALSYPNTQSVTDNDPDSVILTVPNQPNVGLQPGASADYNNPNLSIIKVKGDPITANNILDSLDASMQGSTISITRGRGFLRYKPLKYLYEICNDKDLEKKVLEKTIGNPFKVKFLHDYLVYLLLQRSELMLMSCSSSKNEWNESQKEDYKQLRSAVCAVHKKLRESYTTGFHMNLFQDFRGYNYFSKEIVTKLANVFSNLQ